MDMEPPWGFLEHDEGLLFPFLRTMNNLPKCYSRVVFTEDLPSSSPVESCRTFKTRHGDVVCVELDFSVSSDLF